ncbi:MAG TPA: hypothetical protein VNA11_05915 [Pseudonocardia sp.]|nr:hypothetical protein [Pseudonocardia sp.]
MRRERLLAVAVGAAILAGPWLAPAPHPGPAPDGPPSSERGGRSPAPVLTAPARVAVPAEPTTVLAVDDPVALAVATSSALFGSAPVAVLVAADDSAGQRAAAAVAERVGAPLLLTPADGALAGGDPSGGDPPGADPAGVGAELARLGTRTFLAVGERAVHWAEAAGGSADVVTDEGALPPAAAPAARSNVLVLVPDQQRTLAAAATARASGARTIEVPGGDPRRDPTRIPADVARTDRSSTRLLALGSEFGSRELLDRRLAVAATGTQLPGGGQLAFPGRRIVALYGHPGAPALGVLGEQGPVASVARAGALAAEYREIVDEPVVPAFEIITSVADTVPGPDGDYSAEASVEELQPWVDAAGAAGLYVMLDLQPGRTDFLTQARRYAPLLARPHVGLALDPEWRLRPGQRHGEQIGSVAVEEINAVAGWLAELTRDHALPQKLLMIHQFRTAMIIGRDRLDTSHDELAVLVHADGFGPPGDKIKTWDLLHQLAPDGIHWGWKNFYDEDRPMFTPAETIRIRPVAPVFVSYQ